VAPSKQELDQIQIEIAKPANLQPDILAACVLEKKKKQAI